MPAKKAATKRRTASKKTTPDANVTLNIPGSTLVAFTNHAGYMAEVPDPDNPPSPDEPPGPGPQIPNPQSREEFAIQYLCDHIASRAQTWLAANPPEVTPVTGS